MNKSKQISFGAMITILSIILMYMTSFVPTAKIFLVSLSSFLTAVLIIEVGVSTALLSFLSTSILGIILIPNKLLLIPYITFLGYYGVIKLYIERLDKLILEWIINIVIFNAALYINYILLISVFSEKLKLPFSIILVILGLQILFIIYDYTFSMFIQYYRDRIRRYIK